MDTKQFNHLLGALNEIAGALYEISNKMRYDNYDDFDEDNAEGLCPTVIEKLEKIAQIK